MRAISFGDEAARGAALDAIRTIHTRVHGTLREACGPFPAGTRYSAEDPALLLWVHTTLIDSIVRVYSGLVDEIAETERDLYCAEAADVAVALGACETEVPRSWHALQAYLAAQYASGVIAPCTQARTMAAALLAAPLLPLVAAGLLPEDVRRAYGFPWNRRRDRSFRAIMGSLRMARRLTPRWIAWWPEARRTSPARV